jgi:hypothetical protein
MMNTMLPKKKGKQHGVVGQLGSMKDVADAILINSADTKYTEVTDEKT